MKNPSKVRIRNRARRLRQALELKELEAAASRARNLQGKEDVLLEILKNESAEGAALPPKKDDRPFTIGFKKESE